MSKRCTVCKKKYPDDKKKCPHCGAKAGAPAEEEVLDLDVMDEDQGDDVIVLDEGEEEKPSRKKPPAKAHAHDEEDVVELAEDADDDAVVVAEDAEGSASGVDILEEADEDVVIVDESDEPPEPPSRKKTATRAVTMLAKPEDEDDAPPPRPSKKTQLASEAERVSMLAQAEDEEAAVQPPRQPSKKTQLAPPSRPPTMLAKPEDEEERPAEPPARQSKKTQLSPQTKPMTMLAPPGEETVEVPHKQSSKKTQLSPQTKPMTMLAPPGEEIIEAPDAEASRKTKLSPHSKPSTTLASPEELAALAGGTAEEEDVDVAGGDDVAEVGDSGVIVEDSEVDLGVKPRGTSMSGLSGLDAGEEVDESDARHAEPTSDVFAQSLLEEDAHPEGGRESSAVDLGSHFDDMPTSGVSVEEDEARPASGPDLAGLDSGALGGSGVRIDEEAAEADAEAPADEAEAEEEAPARKEKKRGRAGAWVGGGVLGALVGAGACAGLWYTGIWLPPEWRGDKTPVPVQTTTTGPTKPAVVPDTPMQVAQKAIDQGKFDEAVKALATAPVPTDPKQKADALVERAKARWFDYLQTHADSPKETDPAVQQAQKDLNDALAAVPVYPDGMYWLGQIQENTGQVPQAYAVYKQARDSVNDRKQKQRFQAALDSLDSKLTEEEMSGGENRPEKKPAESKPAPEKPAEENAEDKKPAARKPAAKKPAEEEPAAPEKKPAGEKPAKPADKKPAAEEERAAPDKKPAGEKPAKPGEKKPVKPADKKPVENSDTGKEARARTLEPYTFCFALVPAQAAEQPKAEQPKAEQPKSSDQPKAAEPEEAGFKFWEALRLAKENKYDEALAALDEARKAHERRRYLRLGKAQNPESDPTAQIFLRNLDELKTYWKVRSELVKAGYLGDEAKVFNPLKAFGKLQDDKKAADALVQTVKDKLKLEKDIAKADPELKNVDKDLDLLLAARKQIDDQLTALKTTLEDAKYLGDEQKNALEGLKKLIKDKGQSSENLAAAADLLKADKYVAEKDPNVPEGVKKLLAAKQAGDEKIGDLSGKLKDADATLDNVAKKLAQAKYLPAAAGRKDIPTGLDRVIDEASSPVVRALGRVVGELSGFGAGMTAQVLEAYDLTVRLGLTEEQVGRYQILLMQARTPQQMLDIWVPLLQEGRGRKDLSESAALDADHIAKDKGAGPEVKAEARAVAGLALRNDGKLVEARKTLQEALALPGTPRDNDWRAPARQALKELTDPAAYFLPQADRLRATGKYDEALAVLSAGLKAFPQDAKEGGRLLALRSLVNLDLAESLAGAKGLSAADPGVVAAAKDAGASVAAGAQAEGEYAQGRLAEAVGDWARAKQSYRKAHAAHATDDPDGNRYRVALARAILRDYENRPRAAAPPAEEEPLVEPKLPAAKKPEKKPAEEKPEPTEKKPPDKKPAEEKPEKKPADEPAEEKPGEKKPVKEKPAVKKPAGEKPAEKKPADEPAEEKPGEKKPVKEKPAVKKPAGEKPAEKKPADEPAEEKPAEKKPVKPADKKPAGEKPEKKPADGPAEEKPGEKKPEEPADKKPADEKPGKEARKLSPSSRPLAALAAVLLTAVLEDEEGVKQTPAELTEAERLADEAIRAGDPEGHLIKAQVLAQKGEWADVLKEYLDGMQKLSRRPDRVKVLRSLVENHPAFRIPEGLRSPDPLLAEKHYATGLRLFYDHRYAGAEKQFFEAARYNDQDARYFYFLGMARLSQEKRDDAFEAFKHGGELELQSKPNGAAVSVTLERVQGPQRQTLNRFRP